MDDLRAAFRICPHGMQPVARPDRAQTAEHLVPGESEAAIDPLRLRGREKAREIVAALSMACGEDLARHRLVQHPFQRFVSYAPEIGGNANPVQMHVDA